MVMADLSRAVLCSLDPHVDPAVKQQAFNYCEQIKASDDGWRICLDGFCGDSFNDPSEAPVKFFCLQVVEEFIRTRYLMTSVENKQLLRARLGDWMIKTLPNQTQKEAGFLRNKFAQILTLLAKQEYPNGWPSFFTELMATLNYGNASIDLYLRVLLAVDGEVVAREISRSAEDASRNTLFKDAMREQCLPQLVESWYSILVNYSSSDPSLVNSCLAVVSLYTDWIDVDLIVNERFISLFFQFINARAFRENTCSCFIAIIGKGMDSMSKVKLIQQLNMIPLILSMSESVVGVLTEKSKRALYSSISNLLDESSGKAAGRNGNELVGLKTSVVNGIIVVAPGEEDEDDDENEEDTNFSLKLTKLVATTGVFLTTCFTKIVKGESGNIATPELLGEVERMIESCLQSLHILFRVEDDEIVTELIPFALSYVNILKLKVENGLMDGQRGQLERLLHAVCMKMRYDDSYDFEKEDEEEFLFQEVRKDLKQVFDNIALVCPELVLNYVQTVVVRVVEDLGKAPLTFQNAELALTLLDYLTEAVPGCTYFTEDDMKVLARSAANGSSKSVLKALNPEIATKRTLVVKQLLQGVVLGTPSISLFPHRSVCLQFFESVVKYYKYFITEPQGIREVLSAFLDHRGIRNQNRTVSSRCCYLFLRFCKSLRKDMSEYVEIIVNQLGRLLELQVDENVVADGKGYILTEEGPLGYDDQLFLFEAVGCLITGSSLLSSKQNMMFGALFEPLLQKFDTVMKEKMFLRDTEKKPIYGMFLHQLISCSSRISKGVNSPEQAQQTGAMPYLVRCLDTFVKIFDLHHFRSELAFVCRQYIHRMITCLGRDILPFVPHSVERLLQQESAKDLSDVIPLINQLMTTFKDEITPYINEVFMAIVQTIFNKLNEEVAGNDPEAARDKTMLQKSYYLFLSSIMTNGQSSVLISPKNSQHLNTVLQTVIQGSVEGEDSQTKKLCFSILRKVVESWADSVPGFKQFIVESVYSSSWEVLLSPRFSVSDAQSLLVLNEIAALQLTVSSKCGPELAQFLQSGYYVKLNFPADAASEYSILLQKNEPKPLRAFLKQIITLRST